MGRHMGRQCSMWWACAEHVGGHVMSMCRHMRAGAVQGVLGAETGRSGRHAGRVPRARGSLLGHRPRRTPPLLRNPPAAAQHAEPGSCPAAASVAD